MVAADGRNSSSLRLLGLMPERADGERVALQARFHPGTALDNDVVLAPMTDDELESIKSRVRREFPLTSGGGVPLNAAETTQAVRGALPAMGIRQP